jgi:hypothetical protein
MLAQVPKLRKNITSALLCALAITIASCASTQETPRLVDDPDDRGDSAIPWNKQEKWETTGGQLTEFTDRR